MNLQSVAQASLALITVSAIATSVALVAAPRSGGREVAEALPGPAPDAPAAPRLRADSLARLIAQRNVFRANRSAASARFDPHGPEGSAAPPPAPRPAPVVAGILSSAEPAVLIEGIPGVEGTRVLRVGERVGDYVIRLITADRVVIAGRDTTWTLPIRSRFQ